MTGRFHSNFSFMFSSSYLYVFIFFQLHYFQPELWQNQLLLKDARTSKSNETQGPNHTANTLSLGNARKVSQGVEEIQN